MTGGDDRTTAGTVACFACGGVGVLSGAGASWDRTASAELIGGAAADEGAAGEAATADSVSDVTLRDSRSERTAHAVTPTRTRPTSSAVAMRVCA